MAFPGEISRRTQLELQTLAAEGVRLSAMKSDAPDFPSMDPVSRAVWEDYAAEERPRGFDLHCTAWLAMRR